MHNLVLCSFSISNKNRVLRLEDGDGYPCIKNPVHLLQRMAPLNRSFESYCSITFNNESNLRLTPIHGSEATRRQSFAVGMISRVRYIQMKSSDIYELCSVRIVSHRITKTVHANRLTVC